MITTGKTERFPELRWEFGDYPKGKAVSLVGFNEQGDRHIIASVNMEPYGLDPSYVGYPYVSIKNYSENEGIADLLILEGILQPKPVVASRIGYVTIYTYVIKEGIISKSKEESS